MATKKTTIPGLILTALAALTLVAAAFHWVDRLSPAVTFSTEDRRANERQTALNLRLIIDGQESYREKAMGSGGRQVYATFFTHLWTAVGDDHRPIPLDLIPRDLAFASGVSTAVSGYWYDDLHLKALPDGKRADLNLQEEWGVFALPAVMGESGELSFIATAEGVWSKKIDYVPDAVPYDLKAEGWSLVSP